MSPYLRLEAVGFSLPLSPFCAMQSFHFTQLRVHFTFLYRIALCATYLPIQSAGGDERNRTDDPLLAKQVLSQLSYTPIFN